MIVVGAKGFAKEILQIFIENKNEFRGVFYDDINDEISSLFNKFRVIKTIAEAKAYINKVDCSFILGIGNPKLRLQMYKKFSKIGGEVQSIISNSAYLGTENVKIGKGCAILSGVKISNDVKIGSGCLIYFNTVITHEVRIGDFVEIAPNVSILGRSSIGDLTSIGTGAIIFPDITIGNNVIIGAGSVVRNDVPDNCLVVGTPATIKRRY